MYSLRQSLITWTDKGLYCKAGGFYIDPHRAVDVAVLTHAHSDHARRGSKLYICEESGVGLLKTRIGHSINVKSFLYKNKFQLGEVEVSFHSAGHILGSSQIRIQRGAEVWVASGDYKRDVDPSCEPFESVPCDTFITEATFGTPKFVWDKGLEHGRMIMSWWNDQSCLSRNCLLFGYSLGKGQRILAELYPFAHQPILIHPTMKELTECYRQEGRLLAPTKDLMEALGELGEGENLEGQLILAPPSIVKEAWIHKLGVYRTAFASGWMKGSGHFGRGSYDHGFVMSDHADWNDLNQTIFESGAKRVYVQHRDGALVRHLKSRGIEAYPVEKLRGEPADFGGTPLRLI